VEGIRDQRDDQVDLGNLSVECFVVGDIKRDWAGVLDAFGEVFGTFECPTS